MATAPASDNATTALYRAALGGRNTARYLAVFAEFDERGLARAHWNTAAGLLSLAWLLYRGLWGRALLYATAVAALAALAWWMRPMWSAWPDGVAAGVLGLMVLLAVVVPGLWGDGWLHADVRARMTEAVRRARTVDEACQALARGHRPRHWGLAVAATLALATALWWWSGVGIGVEPAPGAAPEPLAVATEAPPAEPAQPPSQAVPLASPAASEPAESPATPAVADAGAVPTALGAASAAAAPIAAPVAAPLSTASPPVPVSAPAPVEAPVEAKAAPSAADESVRPRPKGTFVNVGLFADPANARRVQERLAAAKLPVLVDPVESSRGTLSRIRVGPFADKAQAEKAAAKVRALGLEAQVRTP